MWTQWIARSNQPYEPFQNGIAARYAWTLLSKLFPERLSAILMPNHLHLVLPHTNAHSDDAARKRLEGFLGGASRNAKIVRLWQPIPPPLRVPDRHHLRRLVRYIALNPCRKKLCADPLEWYWSTYRELFGATAEPGIPSERLASALGKADRNFPESWHQYVSSDESVRRVGTHFPVAAEFSGRAEYSIGSILMASAAALRVPESFVKKRGKLRTLFVHLAYRQGWRQPSLLAEICGVSVAGVHWIRAESEPVGLRAAEICLGDVRFRLGELPKRRLVISELDESSRFRANPRGR